MFTEFIAFLLVVLRNPSSWFSDHRWRHIRWGKFCFVLFSSLLVVKWREREKGLKWLIETSRFHWWTQQAERWSRRTNEWWLWWSREAISHPGHVAWPNDWSVDVIEFELKHRIASSSFLLVLDHISMSRAENIVHREHDRTIGANTVSLYMEPTN